jgi:beta-glucanase (GH16 family)
MLSLLTTLVTMSIATTTPHWTLTFQDDFDGKAGTAPSTAHWARDLGGSGFGNNELESYTDGNSNAFLDGKGNLIIEARKESTTGADGKTCAYSSARLLTKGKFSQAYGKFEARMKIPQGKGIWPAFWLLGESISHGGWPNCGEIDILESVGAAPMTVYGTLHGPGYSGGSGIQGHFAVDKPLSDDFHTYAIEWEPNEIRWYFDGKCYSTVTRDRVANHDWPFDKPFFIILNLAVGGYWPGNPDNTTTFPQRLIVDYVRVYTQKRV